MFRSSDEVNREAQWSVNRFLAKELGIKLLNDAWLLFKTAAGELATSATPAFNGPEANESTPFVFLHPLTKNLYCVRGFGRRMEVTQLAWRNAKPIEEEFIARNPWLVCKPKSESWVEFEDAYVEGEQLIVKLRWDLNDGGNCGGGRELHYDLKSLACLGAKY